MSDYIWILGILWGYTMMGAYLLGFSDSSVDVTKNLLSDDAVKTMNSPFTKALVFFLWPLFWGVIK